MNIPRLLQEALLQRDVQCTIDEDTVFVSVRQVVLMNFALQEDGALFNMQCWGPGRLLAEHFDMTVDECVGYALAVVDHNIG